MTPARLGFNFGGNWQAYSESSLNEATLEIAMQSIQILLDSSSLQGRSFLDIGCGSGLFSIAASRLGATNVVGTDIDEKCLHISKQNAALFADQHQLEFRKASALDSQQLESLGRFSVVYAWGSLHHTGAMWEAIRLVSQRVAPEGQFAISIYNRHLTSPIWKGIKYLYNIMPHALRKLMVLFFAGIIFIAKFLYLRTNPLKKQRGMDFWYDVIDWVGGYPYEYAKPQAVISFITSLGFQLEKFIPAEVPTGCNEYVFTRLR
jgi:2-polyprenyl-6-hydroxyphenyl methylase/3-demethylubiquinone-9 3-methyltransferase